ncbi:MAG: IS1595 family transposase [Rhodomicrobium sp.]|nr:IS1595 family transposase [Rhodomicrobium sp.]
MTHEPKTLVEAVRYFADPDTTLKTIIELRWPDGVCCPTCGSKEVRFISTRRIWECKNKHPKRQFSGKVGTIFEDSPLPLDKWFVAIWAIANCKNGISSYELHRALDVTQKTAWFMLHRIRLAMKAGSIMTSHGQFEADETLIGGLEKNMHANKRTGRTGRGTGKAVVMGIIRRKTAASCSKVKATVVKDASQQSLQTVLTKSIEPGSHLFTDAWQGYRGLSAEYRHQIVDHAVQYVKGVVHTNGCENFFSLLKRTVKGTYISVEPFHLGRYLDEQAFRFNEREDNDGGRFKTLLGSVFGLRLTYKELTGHDAQPA